MDEKKEKKDTILSIIKEFFKKGTVLNKDLSLYRVLIESKGLTNNVANRVLLEIKKEKEFVNRKDLYKQQSKLIKKINTLFGPELFENFVSNYKEMATICLILNESLEISDKVMLEEKIIKNMLVEAEKEKEIVPIDNIVFKTFLKKFNEEYSLLHEEQKDLLKRYVLAFEGENSDIDLKIFLNEEIKRLKEELSKLILLEEISKDNILVEKTKQVINNLTDSNKKKIDKNFIQEVLKIQELVREIRDGN
ncbi:hypothetical protein M0R19_04280 [Candidatus Pacearchaeota archaeon]|nr:hypothetical protein [Candidatus Pacearchaeota archaeon]